MRPSGDRFWSTFSLGLSFLLGLGYFTHDCEERFGAGVTTAQDGMSDRGISDVVPKESSESTSEVDAHICFLLEKCQATESQSFGALPRPGRVR